MRNISSKQYVVSSRNLIFAFIILTAYFLLPTSIHAQSVDLLWQGEGYNPPFYQGKNLWSTQSRITLVAIPQGLGNAANLNYKWIKNGTILGNINGIGRNTLMFSDDILSKSQEIEVEIISQNKEVLARTSVVIKPSLPIVAVYENSPLYGFMFHRKIGTSYQMTEPEVTFTAFPLFFNTPVRSNVNLSYLWKTNTGGMETRDSVTYRIPENASGSSQVSLEISNKKEITQSVRQNFLVEFGQTNE